MHLPVEVFVQIIKYLDTGIKVLMERVNTLCTSIMMEPPIWRVVNVNEILLLDEPTLVTLQSHSQAIRKFIMTGHIITD